ncbi:MAG: hypothetical protein FWD53_12780 [Phycisphaerales bacterium]|nr:hypothetical protein [Phycisphaerales bacterium]
MHTLAESLVGHEVVKRGPVLGILGTMCVVLLGVGWMFQRRSRLEYLAPVALVLSLVATVAMLVLGAVSKGSEPLTVASVSESRVMPGLGMAAVKGATDVYSPSAFEGSVSVPPGAWMLPELKHQAGHIVRLGWGELSPMQWRHLRFPSGATLRGTVGGVKSLEEDLGASGTFGAEGFEGVVAGLAGGKDLLLTGPSGRLAPRMVGEKLVAGVGEQLSGDDMAGAGMITHERAERLKATASILAASPRGGMGGGTMLYAWVEGVGTGVEVQGGGDAERREWTLMAVPVTLERPSGRGEAFVVPSGFMRISNHRIQGQTNPLYDERVGKFIDKIPSGVVGIVRFELPAVVAGMRVEKARLKVGISAPDRTAQVFVPKPGARGANDFKYLGAKINGPIQPIEVEIAGEDLTVDANGGLLVGLEVSAGREGSDSIWELSGMTLTVSGRME